MRVADLSVGLLASIVFHAAIGVYGLSFLVASWNNRIMPDFKHGFSSVEINLTSLKVPEPEPEPVPVVPEEVVAAPKKEDPPPEEVEPVPEKLIDEGVEQGDPEVTADVKPSYPLGARMRGEEGIVTVGVWIDAAGRASRAEVVSSSGYPSLDRAAIKAAKKASFRNSSGDLVDSRETEVTFHFKLVD